MKYGISIPTLKWEKLRREFQIYAETKELSARPMKNMNDLYMKNRLMESDSYDPG